MRRCLPLALAALALPAWAQAPAPSADEQARILDDARVAAIRYTSALPDFLCDQVVRRYKPRGEGWKLNDTLLVRLAFTNRREEYTLVARNGRTTRLDYQQLNGAGSTGEFGSLLMRIYHPASHTDFEWRRWAELRGRRTLVFAFHIPRGFNRHTLNHRAKNGFAQSTPVADRGEVFVDVETRQTVRIVTSSEEIPPGFPIVSETTTLDYDFADVAGARYLLPLRAEVLMTTLATRMRNEIEFTGYRRFAADATITFETPPAIPAEKLREKRPGR